MNKLDRETRAKIIQLLCEGMSIRAITRVLGVGKNTVARLLVDAGVACAAYQDRVLRNLPCERVQVDEIWSFVYAKQGHVADCKAAPRTAGDVWTWTAICADTKLIASFYIGDRGYGCANAFLGDLKERLANRIQLTSDGHRSYLVAVKENFGEDVDYAMLKKIYGSEPHGEKRYSPAVCLGAEKEVITGNPDRDFISTSYAERANLTMRMHMRRFTRLTNAFSKKLENHVCAISLHTMFYNFVRVHQTLKMTPAMAAGVTKRTWEMPDIIDLIEAWESRQVRQTRLAA
jgi:IS1 family transposase